MESDRERNNVRDFLEAKAERIASALYLVSGLMGDNEPMKWELRNTALNLLKEAGFGLEGRNTEELFSSTRLLAATLRVARSTGVVSDMNAGLLLDVIDQFFNEVTDLLKTRNRQILPPPSFAKEHKEQAVKEEKHIKDMSFRKPKLRIATENDTQGRKEEILTIIQSKGQVTVSDIKEFIRDISDKTIQRDLATLVREGKVRKEGDRRWARYFML